MSRMTILTALLWAPSFACGQSSVVYNRSPYANSQREVQYQQRQTQYPNRQVGYREARHVPIAAQPPVHAPGYIDPRTGRPVNPNGYAPNAYTPNGYQQRGQLPRNGYGVPQSGQPQQGFMPNGRTQEQYVPGAEAFRPRPVLPTHRLRDNGFYVPVPPPQQIRKHDIVTVRVDHTHRMESEGNSEMRRTASYDLALTDWLIVDWFRWIKPSPQSDGDPRVAGSLNRQNRAEGDIDTSERLQFNIAVEVRDIYPNGNLLLRGGNLVRINNEVWKVSLSGVCRPLDIGPNNTVLSSNILNLDIRKGDAGQVRDAYKRGWFTRWFDRFHPF